MKERIALMRNRIGSRGIALCYGMSLVPAYMHQIAAYHDGQASGIPHDINPWIISPPFAKARGAVIMKSASHTHTHTYDCGHTRALTHAHTGLPTWPYDTGKSMPK